MIRSRLCLLGLALGGMLLLGGEARAVNVTYTTTGVFSSSGTNLFTAPGVSITFNSGGQVVDANPTTNASFGNFSTIGTSSPTPVAVTTGFTLTIQQITVGGSVAPGSLNYVGSISGTLQLNNGTAFLQFNGPLTQSLPPGVTYSIINADDTTPGKIIIAPPTTNAGITSIQGRITVVPEPSAAILMGLGAVAPLTLLLRRRIKAQAAS